MSTAVTMSAAFAHLMELPGKMNYEAPLYVRLHRTLYPTFGRTAGPAEGCAVATAIALAWLESQHRRSSRLTAVAAGCLAAAHGIFWSVVQPVNVEMMRWPLDAIPKDWTKQRNRWEYGHAIRAGLVTAALGALTWSLLPVTNQPDTAGQKAS
ncbi:MAG: anthrone oxygenase family protein [Vicinamibacterales bacterium]